MIYIGQWTLPEEWKIHCSLFNWSDFNESRLIGQNKQICEADVGTFYRIDSNAAPNPEDILLQYLVNHISMYLCFIT